MELVTDASGLHQEGGARTRARRAWLVAGLWQRHVEHRDPYRAGADSAWLIAIGSDPMNASIKAKWTIEGLETSLVLDRPSRRTGLYAISTAGTGERSFA